MKVDTSIPPELYGLLLADAKSRGISLSRVIAEACAEKHGASLKPLPASPHIPNHIPEGIAL
jgi:hypothetical protein